MLKITYKYMLVMPIQYDCTGDNPNTFEREHDSWSSMTKEYQSHANHYHRMGYNGSFMDHMKMKIKAVIESDWEDYTGQDKD